MGVIQATARRGNGPMNGLPEVWRKELQPVLKMLNRGVIINDETGHIVLANALFLDMLGQQAELVIGQIVPRRGYPSTAGAYRAQESPRAEPI